MIIPYRLNQQLLKGLGIVIKKAKGLQCVTARETYFRPLIKHEFGKLSVNFRKKYAMKGKNVSLIFRIDYIFLLYVRKKIKVIINDLSIDVSVQTFNALIVY